MSKLVIYNANPFNKVLKNDCTIRAFSTKSGYTYKEVCNLMGVKFKEGLGLDSSEKPMVNEIIRFHNKTKMFTVPYVDDDFVNYINGKVDLYEPTDLTVDKFVESNDGKYVLLIIPIFKKFDKISRNNIKTWGHAIYCDCDKKEIYDTKNMFNVKDCIVFIACKFKK